MKSEIFYNRYNKGLSCFQVGWRYNTIIYLYQIDEYIIYLQIDTPCLHTPAAAATCYHFFFIAAVAIKDIS